MASSKIRVCKTCGNDSAATPFPKFGNTCRPCVAAKVRAWYRASVNRPVGYHNGDEPIEQRLERNIERITESGCWLWLGTVDEHGRGKISYRGKIVRVHRLIWELRNGKIPPGMNACHRCDIPLCCNPAHIFIGTQKDNVRDMCEKNRHPKQIATVEQHKAMAEMYLSGKTMREIAGAFGLTRAQVNPMVRRYVPVEPNKRRAKRKQTTPGASFGKGIQ